MSVQFQPPSPTKAQWLSVGLDLAQDQGEITEELTRAVVALLPALLEHSNLLSKEIEDRLLGPWSPQEDPTIEGLFEWRRYALDGSYVASVEEGLEGFRPVRWKIWRGGEGLNPIKNATSLSVRDAIRDADAYLRKNKWILLETGTPEGHIRP